MKHKKKTERNNPKPLTRSGGLGRHGWCCGRRGWLRPGGGGLCPRRSDPFRFRYTSLKSFAPRVLEILVTSRSALVLPRAALATTTAPFKPSASALATF